MKFQLRGKNSHLTIQILINYDGHKMSKLECLEMNRLKSEILYKTLVSIHFRTRI